MGKTTRDSSCDYFLQISLEHFETQRVIECFLCKTFGTSTVAVLLNILIGRNVKGLSNKSEAHELAMTKWVMGKIDKTK